MNDPDVVLTDLGLAALGGYLGWRLGAVAGQSDLRRGGVVIMVGLASAALWGAIFHAFFPAQTATLGGFIAWIPVGLSILVVAVTLLDLALRMLAPRLPVALRRVAVVTYATAFAAVFLLVNESFSTIVRFYVPTLALILITALKEGWTLVAMGFGFSTAAALLQQAEVAIHPVYFDHNAVYHVVQGIALILIYLGFRGTGPAPRPE